MVNLTPQGAATLRSDLVRDAPRTRRVRSDARLPVAIRGRDGVAVISLGDANVWDQGDLSALRAAADRLAASGRPRLGVDLSSVGVLPGGFMNMLCEWRERGRRVYLADPRPNVRAMLWFRKYAVPTGGGLWRINCAPPDELASDQPPSEERPG